MSKIDWKKPTAMMLGRYQPFHDGHFELFKEILTRTGQVAIMVRDTEGTCEKNPFSFQFVADRINAKLSPEFDGKYEIIHVPNITNICYGRDVGYSIEKITMPEHVEAISATDARKKMNIQEEIEVFNTTGAVPA